MDEAEKVLKRLARIKTFDGGGASAPALLGELRELLRDAEAWARVEGDRRALAAVARLDDSLNRSEVVVTPHVS